MIANQILLSCTTTVLWISAIGVLVLSLVLFVECIAALFPTAAQPGRQDWQDKKITVVIPAHNEEINLKSTLAELSSALTGKTDLVVVADNCNDATATIARSAGAAVLERHDPDCRGKGYALDYGLRFLEADPPDVVVFVDADCLVHPGAIEAISQRAIETGRPVQATYLMEKPPAAKPKDAVSAFAFKVKNLVRASGLARLGMPCLLTGTGMAFPWSAICSVNLASSNVVEDMKLGLDLTIAGHPPLFCGEASVTGLLPQDQQAAKTQRTRWEHGHMQMLLSYVPRLLKAAVVQRRLDLLAMALDMCVPPLSLLVMLWAGLSAASVLAVALGVAWMPAILLAVAGLLLAAAIFSAWARFGQSELPLFDLLAIPFYVLWKIPLYVRFMIQPQDEWVRTARSRPAVIALKRAAYYRRKIFDASKP
jgi:cellulose synthase/poly-beta-1,6-N-acetylglucosamine synthase-like glycosyltransferase